MGGSFPSDLSQSLKNSVIPANFIELGETPDYNVRLNIFDLKAYAEF